MDLDAKTIAYITKDLRESIYLKLHYFLSERMIGGITTFHVISLLKLAHRGTDVNSPLYR